MSKRRVPTKVLEMSGALKKNPQRAAARADEPQPKDPIGNAPADFLPIEQPGRKDESGNWVQHPSVFHSQEAKRLLKAWNDIVGMAPEGVLTSADHAHVEMTARVLVRTRREGALSSDFALLDKLLGKIGCNPADRSRVAATKEKSGDADEDWGEFAPRGRQAGSR